MSDRDEWLAERRSGIGASDAAALVGLSRYQSPWSLWAGKVGLLPDRDTTPRQRIGQVLEAAIAQLFHESTGLYVAGEQTWCTHERLGWARATVDGFVVESPESGVDDALGLVEIKTDGRYGWPDGVPVDIRAQCVWQMGVTQIRPVWVAVLHGGFRFEVYPVPWDDAAEDDWHLLVAAGEKMWDHVTSGIPPDIDGSEATQRALEAVYPDHEPGVRVSLDHLADEIAERDLLKATAKTTAERLGVIDNAIREAIGGAEIGTLGGEAVLSYRWSDRAGYVVEATRVRTLRAASKRDRQEAA